MLTRISDRFYRHAAQILICAMTAIVFLTFRHYGVSWDEEIQSQYGQAIFDYYASGFVDTRYNEIFNLYLYGGMFDGLAAFINAYTPVTVYETRHLLNGLIGLLGLWGTWRLGRLLGGGFTGFAAMVLLALMPVYYGHMFNNPKDIPFAAGIVWTLYYMTKSYQSFPGVRLSLMLKLGIVYGLTLGVRVNGVTVIAFWGMLLTFLAFLQARPITLKSLFLALWRLMRVGIPVGLVSYAVMLACWPWAQEAPLQNPLKAILEFSNFPQVVEVLLSGTTYMSTELPWFYVPLYFFVQLPLLQLGLITGGLIGLPWIAHVTLAGWGKKAAMALMLLTVGFPIFYAMVRHPALYDAVRHFTFVLPPLCVLGALALRAALEHGTTLLRPILRTKAQRRGAVAGFLALVACGAFLPLDAMMRLHPYEYMYINEMEGGVQHAYGQFELDYWGSSFKEAAEKLQAHVASEGGVPSGKIYKIAICGPWSAAMIYLPPDYEAVEANEPADFFMATTRWMCQDMRDGKEIVRVERLGVPLSVIKDLRGTEEGRLGMPNYREEQREKQEHEESESEE